MHQSQKERLKAKGWTTKEISHAERIMDSDEKRAKHAHIAKGLSDVLYWMSLLVLLVCNFIISLFLIPFMLMFNDLWLYLVVLTLGLVFGMLFNTLIRSIEHLERKHHLFAAVFIPIVGLIDFAVVVVVANRVADLIGTYVHNNAILTAVVFVGAFMAPYIYTLLKS
ncbi:hypothetical protein JXB02_03135 [Candidatus Woesearchaeota archaeon]|nr:hypothetical protein [Candidatus Woesearchaeota archaeon]